MPMFNVNAWVEEARGPGQSDLIDTIFEDKKYFAATRPAAIVLADADIAEAVLQFDPPYTVAQVTRSVDQLQAVGP